MNWAVPIGFPRRRVQPPCQDERQRPRSDADPVGPQQCEHEGRTAFASAHAVAVNAPVPMPLRIRLGELAVRFLPPLVCGGSTVAAVLLWLGLAPVTVPPNLEVELRRSLVSVPHEGVSEASGSFTSAMMAAVTETNRAVALPAEAACSAPVGSGCRWGSPFHPINP